MPKKRHTPEQIIDNLREVEVLLAKCLTLPGFCRKIEVTALFTLPRATTSSTLGRVDEFHDRGPKLH